MIVLHTRLKMLQTTMIFQKDVLHVEDHIQTAYQAVRCLMTKMHPIITTIYTHVGEQKKEVFERYGVTVQLEQLKNRH